MSGKSNQRGRSKSDLTEKEEETNATDQGGDDEFIARKSMLDMLKVQESMFRSLFDSMLTSVNSRIDEIYKTVRDLKTRLEFSLAEVQDLKKAGDQISEIEQELDEVHEQIGFHCDKIKYHENHSSRNNIRIDRIPEGPVENWEKTESKRRWYCKVNSSFPFRCT